MKLQIKIVAIFAILLLISEGIVSYFIYTASVKAISDSVGIQAMHTTIDNNGQMIANRGAATEAKDINGFMKSYQQRSIFVFLSVILVTILFFLFLTRLLLAPLRALTRKVKKIRGGNFEDLFDIKSKDEIGELNIAIDEIVCVVSIHQSRISTAISALSSAHNYNDMEQMIVKFTKEMVAFTDVNIAEYPSDQNTTSDENEWLQNRLAGYCARHPNILRIGNMIDIDNGHLLPIGKVNQRNRILCLSNHPSKMNQTERLSLQLLSRYTAIFYENLSLIEKMSKRIIELELQSDHSSWMSKMMLQMSENERKRLSCDLHDDVLQEVIRTKKVVDKLSLMPTVDREMKKTIKSVEENLLNITYLIRETCNELLPSFLAEEGIVHSIEKYIQKTLLRANFHINFEAFPIEAKLDFEECLVVYRVIQELLNNAMTHADATEVEILLRQDGPKIVIFYSDNGIGMDLDAAVDTSKHLGLISIRERIKALNGQTTYLSYPGVGLEVSCQFLVKNPGIA